MRRKSVAIGFVMSWNTGISVSNFAGATCSTAVQGALTEARWLTSHSSMLRRKQTIVGDAFRLPSRDPRYHLDLVLIVPLFFAGLFLLESVHTWHINGLGNRVCSRFPSMVTFQRTSRSRQPTAFFPFRSRTRPGGRFGHSVPHIHFEDTGGRSELLQPGQTNDQGRQMTCPNRSQASAGSIPTVAEL